MKFLFLFILLILNIKANDNLINLTKEEKIFIKSHPAISLVSSIGYEPFLIQNSDGTISGHDRELLDIIEQKTGLKFKITLGVWDKMQQRAIKREFDGLTSVGYVKEREKHYNPSKAYLKFMTFIVTKKGNPKKIHQISDLNGKTIAIEKGNFLFIRIIKELNQNIKIVWVDSINDMISAVASNQADFTVLDETVFYISKQIGLQNSIDTPFTIGEPFDVLFWLRKDYPELQTIINKVLDSIDAKEKLELRDRWFKNKKEFDYELFFKIIGVIIVFSLFLLYRQYELKKLNKDLDEKIKDELEKSRKKDNLIFMQNKMASLGEMVGNIAHQWRQPLSELTMGQNLILAHLKNNTLDNKLLYEEINDAQKIIKEMSNIISTFERLYNTNNTNSCSLYSLDIIINDIRYILLEQLRLNNIKLDIDIQNNIQIKNDPDLIKQLFLIILQNSIVFLKDRKIKNPFIKIEIIKNKEKMQISIIDNAKGIDEEVLPHIFEYNYSKRDGEENSTGLGLYIAKLIVEEKLKGKIEASNTLDGTCFKITLQS